MIHYNNFKIKLKYIILLLIVLIIFLFLFWYIPNTNSVKNIITSFDLRYYDVLSKEKLVSYNDLILNSNFLSLVKQRDKHNLNCNKNIYTASIMNSWKKIYLLPNMFSKLSEV